MNRPLAIGADRIRVRPRVEQRIHHRQMAAHRRGVQGRFARIVAGAGKRRIARQLLPYAGEITAARRVQKAGDAFHHRKVPRQDREQQLGNVMVIPVLRHGHERFLKRVGAVGRIGSLFQQEAHNLQMTFAHREVDRRRVVVFAYRQLAPARHQRLHLVQVPVRTRLEHGPNILVLEVYRMDHN